MFHYSFRSVYNIKGMLVTLHRAESTQLHNEFANRKQCLVPLLKKTTGKLFRTLLKQNGGCSKLKTTFFFLHVPVVCYVPRDSCKPVNIFATLKKNGVCRKFTKFFERFCSVKYTQFISQNRVALRPREVQCPNCQFLLSVSA